MISSPASCSVLCIPSLYCLPSSLSFLPLFNDFHCSHLFFFFTLLSFLSPQLRVTSRYTQKHCEAIERRKHIPYNFDSRRSVEYKFSKCLKWEDYSHVNVLAFWDCLELKCIKLELINVLLIKSSKKKSYLMQKKNGYIGIMGIMGLNLPKEQAAKPPPEIFVRYCCSNKRMLQKCFGNCAALSLWQRSFQRQRLSTPPHKSGWRP